MVVCLVTTLLKIFHRIHQWKKFENRSIFGKDMDKTLWITFLGPPCIHCVPNKEAIKRLAITFSNLNRFQNSFTAEKRMKFPTKLFNIFHPTLCMFSHYLGKFNNSNLLQILKKMETRKFDFWTHFWVLLHINYIFIVCFNFWFFEHMLWKTIRLSQFNLMTT